MNSIYSRIDVPVCNFNQSDPSATGKPLPAGKHLWRGPYDKNQNRDFSSSNILILSPEMWNQELEKLHEALSEGYEYLRNGFEDYYNLSRVKIQCETFGGDTFNDYLDVSSNVADQGFDLIIFLVSEEMERRDFSPYLAAKLHLIDQGIPSQMVKIETINDSETFKNSIINLSTQIYAKLGGTPWILNDTSSEAKFILGVGKSEFRKERIGTPKKTLGFTTVFQDDGSFRYYSSTPVCIEENSFEEQMEETILKSVEQFENELERNDKITIHVYKSIGSGERNAAKKLEEKYDINISLLYLDTNTNFEVFDPDKTTCAASAGTLIPTGSSQAILNTDGHEKAKVRGVVSTRPIWIKAEGASSSFHQDVRDVYYLCYVYWPDQFGATRPITIKYAKSIAEFVEKANMLNELGRLDINIDQLGQRGKLEHIPWFI